MVAPTMTAPAIRPATEDDLPRIVALLADDPLGRAREAFDPAAPPDAAYLDAFRAIADNPNEHLVVLDDGGAVVGCLQLSLLPGLSRRGSWRGQIEGVRVAASHRGAGLGERLVGWAIDACRARGCALVQLTTDRSRADAHRFYERLGFVPSHVGMKLPLEDDPAPPTA